MSSPPYMSSPPLFTYTYIYIHMHLSLEENKALHLAEWMCEYRFLTYPSSLSESSYLKKHMCLHTLPSTHVCKNKFRKLHISRMLTKIAKDRDVRILILEIAFHTLEEFDKVLLAISENPSIKRVNMSACTFSRPLTDVSEVYKMYIDFLHVCPNIYSFYMPISVSLSTKQLNRVLGILDERTHKCVASLDMRGLGMRQHALCYDMQLIYGVAPEYA